MFASAQSQSKEQLRTELEDGMIPSAICTGWFVTLSSGPRKESGPEDVDLPGIPSLVRSLSEDQLRTEFRRWDHPFCDLHSMVRHSLFVFKEDGSGFSAFFSPSTQLEMAIGQRNGSILRMGTNDSGVTLGKIHPPREACLSVAPDAVTRRCRNDNEYRRTHRCSRSYSAYAN